MCISIHAPLAGRDLCRWETKRRIRHFNPRAPCGARRKVLRAISWIVIFQSTRPLRGATSFPRLQKSFAPFQSTRPLRGATLVPLKVSCNVQISIHAPLAGRDLVLRDTIQGNGISIHAPLAGRDAPRHRLRQRQGPISIHAPLAGRDRGRYHH